MSSIVTIDLRHVARGLDVPLRQIQAVVELLDEGNTVPFITRYRKDRTGGLDEEQIREIQSRLAKMRLLADRKQTILRSIEAQGKLTEKLAKQIHSAMSTKRLEDLYLPYKPKKQTLATLARTRGLEETSTMTAFPSASRWVKSMVIPRSATWRASGMSRRAPALPARPPAGCLPAGRNPTESPGRCGDRA